MNRLENVRNLNDQLRVCSTSSCESGVIYRLKSQIPHHFELPKLKFTVRSQAQPHSNFVQTTSVNNLIQTISFRNTVGKCSILALVLALYCHLKYTPIIYCTERERCMLAFIFQMERIVAALLLLLIRFTLN